MSECVIDFWVLRGNQGMGRTKKSYAGIDVGKYKSSIVVIEENGTILCEAELRTSIEEFRDFFCGLRRPPDIIAMESGSISRLLCLGLQQQGYCAIVIDARHASGILRAMKQQKTDRNDAFSIANLIRLGGHRQVWLRSTESMAQLLLLQTRHSLIKIEVDLKNTLAAHLTARGHTAKFGQRRSYVKKFDEYFAVSQVGAELEGLYQLLRSVGTRIDALEDDIDRAVSNSPVCQRLMTIPGVGRLTAVWYEAVIDDPHRFRCSRDVGAYLGLVPSVYQTGNVRKVGRITKSGSVELRRNLYLAARTALYSVKRETRMKSWAMRLRKKKGGKVATIALARRMAVTMHAVWVSGESFRDGG
jgi:transposase